MLPLELLIVDFPFKLRLSDSAIGDLLLCVIDFIGEQLLICKALYAIDDFKWKGLTSSI